MSEVTRGYTNTLISMTGWTYVITRQLEYYGWKTVKDRNLYWPVNHYKRSDACYGQQFSKDVRQRKNGLL